MSNSENLKSPIQCRSTVCIHFHHPFLLIFVILTVPLLLTTHRQISGFPWCRLRHEYAGAVVYNVNTTPAVIDSVREMSPLGFSDVYAGEW